MHIFVPNCAAADAPYPLNREAAGVVEAVLSMYSYSLLSRLVKLRSEK